MKAPDRLKEKIFLQVVDNIIKLISLSLVAILITFTVLLINKHNEFEASKPEAVFYCGTTNYNTPTRSIHDTLYTDKLLERLEEGKAIFRQNCAACHNKNMRDHLTGPALGGVQERWGEYPKEDLYSFIKNSQSMIDAGHPMAVAIWEEWQPTIMNTFSELTDEEIDAVLLYIESIYDMYY
jgi:cytochrome c2